MLPKIYAALWLMVLLAGTGLYLAGNLTDLVLTVFGFVTASMTIAFLVAVLPWSMDKHYTWT